MYHLNNNKHNGLTDDVKRLLADPTLVKTGVNVAMEANNLFRDTGEMNEMKSKQIKLK